MGLLDDLSAGLTSPDTSNDQGILGTAQNYWDKVFAPSTLPEDTAGTPEANAARAPHNVATKALDLFSRLSYGSNAFMDTVAQKGMSAFGEALAKAGSEIVAPKERLTFDDILDRYVPQFGKEAPITKKLVGFVGGIVTDPLTWLSAGAAGPEVTAGEGLTYALSKAGVLARGERAAQIMADTEQVANLVEKATVADKFARTPAQLAQHVVDKSASEWMANYIKNGGDAVANLVDKGGLKFAGKTIPYTPEIGKAIADKTGLSKLTDWIGSMRGVSREKYFVKQGIEPQQAKDLSGVIDRMNVFQEMNAGMADRKAADFFQAKGVFNKKSREDIGNFLEDVRDTTSKALQDNTMQNEELKKMGVVDSFTKTPDQTAQEIFNQKLIEHGFTQDGKQKEFDMIGALKQFFHTTRETHQQAGIIYDSIHNYSPRVFKSMPTDDLVTLSEWQRHGFARDWLPAGMQSKFDSMASAKAAGFTPEYDAANILGAYIKDSDNVQKIKEFNDSIKQITGIDSWDKLPEPLKKELRFMGDHQYSIFGTDKNNAARRFLQGMDKAQNLWKKMATVVKPYFAPRQFIQNISQGFLEGGLPAMKSLDPRNMQLAAAFTLRNHKGFEDILKGLEITDQMGNKIHDAEDLYQLMQGLGVQKGVGGLSEQKLVSSAGKQLDALAGSNQAMQKIRQMYIDGRGGIDGQKGFEKFMTMNGIVGKYLNWGGHVEDLNRTALWLNAIKSGLTPEESVGKVNRALFDYGHGMSEFQTQIMKRAIPFFTFQRFAGQLIAETALKNPGRIANTARTFDSFASVFGKTMGAVDNMMHGKDPDLRHRLTADEENALPGYMFDDPYALKNWAPDMKAHFLQFTNFSPLDIMGSVEDDGKGNMDFEKMAKKLFMGQITPFIKMPIEYFANKNFFTDQAIADAKSPGKKLGQVDPAALISNIASNILGASTNQAAVAALAQKLGEPLVRYQDALTNKTGMFTQFSLENIAKKALGWKEIQDKQGKTQVYINPYMAWAIGDLYPMFGQAVNQGRPDLSPLEKALSMTVGAQTRSINLKGAAKGKFIDLASQYQELKAEVTALTKQHDLSEAEKRRQDAQKILEELRQAHLDMNLSRIEGY